MSDTPRTDNCEWPKDWVYEPGPHMLKASRFPDGTDRPDPAYVSTVPASLARQLERELAGLKARIEATAQAEEDLESGYTDDPHKGAVRAALLRSLLEGGDHAE